MQSETLKYFDEAHLADELNFLSLNLLHHHDLHFVEEVQREVTQSVSVTGQFIVSMKHVYCTHLEFDECLFSSLAVFEYLRMDFWMSSTLQPAFLICFTMLRM